MKGTLKLFVLGAAITASSSIAFATPVTPGGGTVTASNAITVTNDGIVAQIVNGTLTASTFTGLYSEFVIMDGSNPYGANDLTFLIAVSNNTGSPNGIEHVSNGDGSNSFALFPSINVGYTGGGYGNDAPVTIDETIYGTVEFNFTGADAIGPGTGTEYLVIQTPATNFATGNIAVIDSSTDTENGFVPALAVTATPEPNSLVLLGTGLIGAAGLLFARRRHGSSLG